MMGGDFSMGFGGGFMWLFWILLIVAIVWAARAAIGIGNSKTNHGKSPLEILKERYARGEVNQEEFERMKTNLDGRE